MAKSDAEKAAKEQRAFANFIQRSGLPIDLTSVQSRPPPEPDILCRHQTDGWLAFELAAITAEDIARVVHARNKASGTFIRSSDPTSRIAKDKLTNDSYMTRHPIELLFYNDGQTVSPDDMILVAIKDQIACSGSGLFRRIWLAADKCHLVWPEPSDVPSIQP